MLAVQPIFYIFAARRRALSDFILMVRKNQVNASAMDVYAFQIFLSHGTAFYVPARPSFRQPLGLPMNITVFAAVSLPQREIFCLFFFVLVAAAFAFSEFRNIQL